MTGKLQETLDVMGLSGEEQQSEPGKERGKQQEGSTQQDPGWHLREKSVVQTQKTPA